MLSEIFTCIAVLTGFISLYNPSLGFSDWPYEFVIAQLILIIWTYFIDKPWSLTVVFCLVMRYLFYKLTEYIDSFFSHFDASDHILLSSTIFWLIWKTIERWYSDENTYNVSYSALHICSAVAMSIYSIRLAYINIQTYTHHESAEYIVGSMYSMIFIYFATLVTTRQC